jgi:hypothetical protein
MNELLTLFVVKDPKSEQYAKVFEKTVTGNVNIDSE